jgi:hypothetical protein
MRVQVSMKAFLHAYFVLADQANETKKEEKKMIFWMILFYTRRSVFSSKNDSDASLPSDQILFKFPPILAFKYDIHRGVPYCNHSRPRRNEERFCLYSHLTRRSA